MAIQGNIGLMPMAFKADEALDDYQYYCVYAASTAGYVARATGASAPQRPRRSGRAARGG